MTTTPARYGITIPFDGITLKDHKAWFARLVELGYTDVWSAEVDGVDGFTPLALAAAWQPSLNLGVAIIPAYTRGPALLAQSAAAIAECAPGKFALGLGASSQVIVERWNSIAYDEPYKKTRDVLRFLKAALAGEKIDATYDTFAIKGFKLARPLASPPPIYLAALRPGMLRLSGAEADGTILNWLSANDVAKVVHEIDADKPVCARLFVIPTEDADLARFIGRRMITAYLNVPVYAEFHRWLGREPALAPMWTKWAEGDRKGALEVIPDEVVDDLIIHGSYAQCREHIARYVAGGVTIPALAVIPAGVELDDAISGLAPR